MKKSPIKIWMPFMIGLALGLGVFIGGKLNFTDAPSRLFTANSKKDKLNRLIDYIEFDYVDAVNTDSIVDVTVNQILEKLDPHSVYIPKEHMADEAEKMKGDFVGIGVSFYMYKDSLAIIKPIEGGPSADLGIEPGDRILVANGDTIYGKKYASETVVGRLKGLANTKVDLTIYRKTDSSYHQIKIPRKAVPIKSVDAYYMLNDSLGYIKINRFAESTYKEFKNALDVLLDQQMTQLVLDLRDNPGGYLGIAEQIADEFLEDDKLILFTKNKNGQVEETYATEAGEFEHGHVYVLINEQSASASEIIAGALQDNDKGTIVGRRSFGKGLVQREMNLGDGSAVRLTISRYYTPTGRSIQKPYGNGNQDYYHEFRRRWESGELSSIDSIKVADSLKFKTPNGKIVYGGGGIIPDWFIPIESNGEASIDMLEESGFLRYFIFEHLDKDRNRYNYLNKETFVANYVPDDILFSNFIEYCQVPTRQLNLDFYKYENKIKRYLKATIASQLFDDNTAEMLLNLDDPMLQRILKR
ncbi:MAG: S41 family peptidase [Flavobacteriaceae bacterium]|nr:S41 family peptidase [Flavobacteriaceae bacterium]